MHLASQTVSMCQTGSVLLPQIDAETRLACSLTLSALIHVVPAFKNSLHKALHEFDIDFDQQHLVFQRKSKGTCVTPDAGL